jgi:predicted DNA-binding transcriptional regulator YafY
VIGKNFAPTYEHVPERVLTALTQGFGDGVSAAGGALLTCEFPMMFNQPTMSVLAPVTRAINQKKAVKLRYYSHTSGATERVIVPFALVNDGLRWHVRAYDCKSKDFRDFVFTRMEATEIVEDFLIENHELSTSDIQWNRMLELELIPHPAREHPEIIEHDYGMTSGVLHVKVRAAIAGYLLRLWIVDCSPGHILEGEEYRLCLKDDLVLYGVSSAIFAPGYESPRK